MLHRTTTKKAAHKSDIKLSEDTQYLTHMAGYGVSVWYILETID